MNEIKYPIFEPNQVLTSDVLNDLTVYFHAADKDGAHALGKGIMGGLDGAVAVDGNLLESISIGCGGGITSGGLHVQIDDCVLRHARDYEDPAHYPQFWSTSGETEVQKDIIELLEASELDGEDEQTELQAADKFANLPWQDFVLLLYVECVERDLKSCTLEDCSDRGREVLVNVRKLLIGRDNIEPADETVDDAFLLKPLRMPRVREFFDPNTGNPVLPTAFKKKCEETIVTLVPRLADTWQFYGALLADLYPSSRLFLPPIESNPHETEREIGDELIGKLEGTDLNQTQVFYDFLRDLVSAYNDFIQEAVKITADDCPDPTAFPRHLLLGELDWDGEGLNPYRHYFCPRSAPSEQDRLIARARRLHKKIETMVLAFNPSEIPDDGVKIRPQHGIPSSGHVIPYYYQAEGEGQSLRDLWSPRPTERSLAGDVVTTYGEIDMDGQPNPADENLDDMGFLRIEGHLGNPFDDALVTRLETLRDRLHLPFKLLVLRLKQDPNWDPITALCQYPEMNRQYWDVRDALLHQFRRAAMDLAAQEPRDEGWLSYVNLPWPGMASLLDRIDDCIERLEPDLRHFQAEVFHRHYARMLGEVATVLSELHRFAEDASGRLLNYRGQQYDTGKSCGPYYMLVALAIRRAMVVLEALFDATHCNRVRRLGSRLQFEKQALIASDPSLLNNFVEIHPGLEHVAGVNKGGTFILVEDGIEDRRTVVADFHLPYLCCQPDCPDFGDFRHHAQYCPIFIEREWATKIVLLDGTTLFRNATEFWICDVEAGEFEGIEKRAITLDGGPVPFDRHRSTLELVRVPETEQLILILRPGGDAGVDRLAFGMMVRTEDQPEIAIYAFFVTLKPGLIVACDDVAVTVKDKPVIIDLIANDLLPAIQPQVGIIRGPLNGKLLPVIDEKTDRPIPGERIYQPATDFVGRDYFDYQIVVHNKHRRGVISVARVTIHVSDCCDPEPPEDRVEVPEVSLPTDRFCDDGANCYYFTIRGAVIDLKGPGIRWESIIVGADRQLRDLTLVRKGDRWEIVKDSQITREIVSAPAMRVAITEPFPRFSSLLRIVPPGMVRLGTTTHSIGDLELTTSMVEQLSLGDPKKISISLRPCFDPSANDVAPGPNVFAYTVLVPETGPKVEKLPVTVIPLPETFSFKFNADQSDNLIRTYDFEFETEIAANYTSNWDFGDGQQSIEAAPTHQYVLQSGISLGTFVTLRVGIADLPECVREITRKLWLNAVIPGDLGLILTERFQVYEEFIKSRELVEIVLEKDLTKLKREAAFIDVIGKLIEGADGAIDYQDNKLDSIVRNGGERATGTTVDLIAETASARGVGAVEPILDIYRTQLDVSLNFVKLKNQPITEELGALIDTVESQLNVMKEAGVPINQDNKTFTMLEGVREGLADEEFDARIIALEELVLSS